MLICQYCSKDCKNENSHKNHERLCPNNLNRVYTNHRLGKIGGNQYTKGTAKPISDLTRKKLSDASKKIVWTEEKRLSHSEAMKTAVANNPDSYSSGNRGRVKRIEYDGVSFQGKWELYFYQWCKRNNVNVGKCTEWFEYEWNGIRKYFPDFILPDHETYVEVKGYKTERDTAKWNQFKNKLLVVDKKDIPKLLNDTYELGI
jgi:hypothetical protein